MAEQKDKNCGSLCPFDWLLCIGSRCPLSSGGGQVSATMPPFMGLKFAALAVRSTSQAHARPSCVTTSYSFCFDPSVSWIFLLLLGAHNTLDPCQIPSAPPRVRLRFVLRHLTPHTFRDPHTILPTCRISASQIITWWVSSALWNRCFTERTF